MGEKSQIKTLLACGMVGQLVNFLMPSRNSGSASTLALPYLTPAAAVGMEVNVKLCCRT